MIQPGDVLRNRYRIESFLGRGGMSDVYLAFDVQRQAHVAIKMLREDLAEDPAFLRRFSREAEALAKLDHPNITRFYSFEQEGTWAFIVMDYIEGETLRRMLVRHSGALDISLVTSVLRQVGSALQYAHSLGFVHRDIKPGNIMVEKTGRVLLSDFGIVHAVASVTTTFGTAGTPVYMSPEQIKGEEVDARTDIYSLGVVLYEAATGRRPFTGEEEGLSGASTIARLQEAHLKLPPPDPRTFNAELPEKAAAVILKALEKNPQDRWQSAVDMVYAWEEALGLEHEVVLDDATRAKIGYSLATIRKSRAQGDVHEHRKLGECTYLGAEALVLGEYRVRDCLGVNGFVETYLVEHVESGVWKALKVADRRSHLSDPDGFEAIRQRFRLGAELGQKLEHPNILKEEQFVDEGDRLYLVTEYAPGGSLAKRILEARERGEPIPVDAVVRIGLDVAKGLAYLHERDVVHCDLKPGNVLFGESGRAMVGDLGLVQAPWVSGSRVVMRDKGMKLLSPEYMSPEQWHGSKFLTPASDVYSLGTVLFEALTGRLYKIVKPGTRVRDLREEVPGWLDELIARMLAVDPASRPWDGSEVEKELKAGLDRMEQERREKERLAALKELYRRGKELLDQRKWKEAVAGFEELLKEEPGYEDAEEFLAETRKELRREEERRQAVDLKQRLGVECARVLAGEFLMGISGDDEYPQHKVCLGEYWIGKTEVTNAQYEAFVAAGGYKQRKYWTDAGWKWKEEHNITQPLYWDDEGWNKPDHPVVGVSWYEAVAFTRWLSEVSGLNVRLPTEAEWEKACRGTNERKYPWGDRVPNCTLANFRGKCVGHTAPVGSYPAGASPYGVLDMAGNVWEWASSLYRPYPYAADDGRENIWHVGRRVVRGGSWRCASWYMSKWLVRCDTRYRKVPDVRDFDIGFRIVCLPSKGSGN